MPSHRHALSLVALLAALLALPATSQATPVATDSGSYSALGAVFPDPLAGCASGPCPPDPRGNTPATQFIQWEELLGGLEFMNTQNGEEETENWARFMEVLVLDGKLGDGAQSKDEAEADPATMFPGNNLGSLEFEPKPEYVSAGLPSIMLGREKSDLIVVRVTDETVPDAGKKRYALSLSIHGIERAGAEGGTRAIEDLVTSFTTGRDDEPILAEGVKENGRTPTFAEVLRETIIYFTYPNPDGWRRGSFFDTGTGPGVFFQRYNGNGVDPNRDWPDVGYTFRPYSGGSEPETRAFFGFYDGVRDLAPFAAGDDLHGMPGADALSYTLLPHGSHDLGKDTRIRETAITINRSTYEEVKWSPYVKENDEVSNPDDNPDQCAGDVPIYEYCTAIYGQTWGSVYDTINYTTTGTLGDWFDSRLGLNADGIDNEMAFSHLDKNIVFDPHTEQLHVDGNKALIYAHVADMLDPVSGRMEAPGRQGYVRNSRIERQEQDLQGEAPPGTQPQEDIDDATALPSPDAGGQSVYEFLVERGPKVYSGGMRIDVTVPNFQGVATGSATLSVQCRNCDDHAADDPANPDEWITVAEDYNQAGPPLPVYAQAGLTATVNAPDATYTDDDGKPQPVEWRVVIGVVGAPAGPANVDIDFTAGPASSDGNTGGGPPPKLLGYDIANTDFFEDLDAFITDPAERFEAVSPRRVIDGDATLDGLTNLVLADSFLPGYTGLYKGQVANKTDAASDDFTFQNKTPGAPPEPANCDSAETHDFAIPAADDNRLMTARIQWGDFKQDWDLFVLRKNADGEYEEVDSSTSFNGTTSQASEEVEIPEPSAGDWRIEVRNCTAAEPEYTGTVEFEPWVAPPPSRFTPAEKNTWVAALRDYVRGGGNLVLTDSALQAGLAELTDIAWDDVQRTTVYTGQMTFRRCLTIDDAGECSEDEQTLEDPLSRNVNQPGSRFNTGMRRQVFEPTPLGFAIQDENGDDESNARQYDVDHTAFTDAGGRVAAAAVDSGDRDAAPVLERVTMGELEIGQGTLRIAGSLLPQPSTEFDHPLGLEPHALTYTGYILVCNLLDAACTTTRSGGGGGDGGDGDGDGGGGDGTGGGGGGGDTGLPPQQPPGGGGDPDAAPTACASRAGFRSTGVTPVSKRRNVRLGFARRAEADVDIDVFQSANRRGRIGEHRVALFRNRTTSKVWNGRSNTGKKIRNGIFFVRFRTQGVGERDWRRHTLVRRGGRFYTRRTFYRPNSCGLLSSAKLYRPAFGGTRNFPLRAAFRVGQEANVTIVVKRGRRVVKRVTRSNADPRRTHRVLFAKSGRRWKKGVYKVRIRAQAGDRRGAAKLVAQRL